MTFSHLYRIRRSSFGIIKSLAAGAARCWTVSGVARSFHAQRARLSAAHAAPDVERSIAADAASRGAVGAAVSAQGIRRRRTRGRRADADAHARRLAAPRARTRSPPRATEAHRAPGPSHWLHASLGAQLSGPLTLKIYLQ